MRFFYSFLVCVFVFAFNLTTAHAFQKTPAPTSTPVTEAAIVRKTATELSDFYSKCTAFYSIQFIIYDKSADLKIDPLTYKQKTANALILARTYAGLLKYDEEKITAQTALEAKKLVATFPNRKEAFIILSTLSDQCEEALADPKKTMLIQLRQNGAPEEELKIFK